MLNYKDWVTILPTAINGFQVINIDNGEYAGVRYCYGKVSITEENDEATLHFEYNIQGDKIPVNKISFKQFTGDILISIMETQLENNEVIYANGTD